MKIDFACNLPITDLDIIAFFKENWNKEIILTDPCFYEWQFKNITSKYKNLNVVAYDYESQSIVGVMGLNPRSFYVGAKKLQGAELTTWIVDSNRRGGVIASGIIDFLKIQYDVLIGMAITDAALSVYLRKDFRYLHRIPRHYRVLDFDALEEYSRINPLSKKLARVITPSIGKYKVSEVLRKGDLDRIFEEFSQDHNLAIRDFEHINWRYIEHPYFKYKIVVLEGVESQEKAVLIYRIHEIDGSFSVMHLMDIFGDSGAILLGIDYVTELAIKSDVALVDFYCTSSSINSLFKIKGWFSILDDVFIEVPHLFSPIELRSPASTSMIYWSSKPENMYDLGKLYITKQDSDLDRPTPHQFKV